MKKILLSAALLSAGLSYAGGFRVSLQGVRQLAMAHTSAHTEDASVAFFNPAGISFIPSKLSVAAGGFGAQTAITFQNTSTYQSTETDSPMGTPVYAAVAYKALENLSVGFSFSAPFGSTIEWPNDWEGREMVQKMELKALYFQPMISVKLAPYVSFGASYIYAKGLVDWDKAVTQLGGTMNIQDKAATGSGFSIGFYAKPIDKWDFSIAYRSPVDIKAKNGTVTFNTSPALYSVLGLDANGQDKFTATLPLVEEYTLGATYQATPAWKVSADLNLHGWSRYNSLTLDFANAKIGNQASDPTILTTPKNFKNTRTIRIGTEYQVSNAVAVRGGWYYDESPYEDKDFIAETPSFNANVVTAGLGFKFGGLGVDLAGGYVLPKSRAVNNTYYNFVGQAKGKVYYFGLGLNYNLIK